MDPVEAIAACVESIRRQEVAPHIPLNEIRRRINHIQSLSQNQKSQLRKAIHDLKHDKELVDSLERILSDLPRFEHFSNVYRLKLRDTFFD